MKVQTSDGQDDVESLVADEMENYTESYHFDFRLVFTQSYAYVIWSILVVKLAFVSRGEMLPIILCMRAEFGKWLQTH
jgi:hypothetical protein